MCMQVRLQLMLKFQHYNIILNAMNIKNYYGLNMGANKIFREICCSN